MKSLTRLFILGASLLLTSGFAHAGVPISVSPDPISFGDVGLNTTVTLNVEVSNITPTPITISAIADQTTAENTTISTLSVSATDSIGPSCPVKV